MGLSKNFCRWYVDEPDPYCYAEEADEADGEEYFDACVKNMVDADTWQCPANPDMQQYDTHRFGEEQDSTVDVKGDQA